MGYFVWPALHNKLEGNLTMEEYMKQVRQP